MHKVEVLTETIVCSVEWLKNKFIFTPNFVVSNCCSSYYLVSGSGEMKAECHASSDTQPYCFLTQHASNPEASRTMPLATLASTHCTQPTTGDPYRPIPP